MKLNRQVAVVTGAGSGIGAATAKTLAAAKLDGVVVADINGAAAEEIAATIRDQYGCKALGVTTDVGDPAQVEALIETTVRELDRVDILVNNAGICPVIAWDDTTLDDWHHILNVNLTGAYVATRAALPPMRRQKYGRIVYISSVGAFQGSVVAHVAYGVSKSGMIALMKSVAKEFAKDGITANAIAPGTINTPLTDSFGEQQKQRFIEVSPMKRQAEASEIGDAVLYLVSDRSTYVTGATLHVNGGSLLV